MDDTREREIREREVIVTDRRSPVAAVLGVLLAIAALAFVLWLVFAGLDAGDGDVDVDVPDVDVSVTVDPQN